MIKLKGWRCGELNTKKLKRTIEESSVGKHLWRRAALAILGIGTMSDVMNQYPNSPYMAWLKSRGRWVMKEIVKLNPEKYGLVRINPDEIDKAMTTKELLNFCEVGKKKLSELVKDAPENGLQKPSKQLGRTLKGRSYIFPADVAREYAKRLIK